MTLKKFLEEIPIYQTEIIDAVHSKSTLPIVTIPNLKLFCNSEICNGYRLFANIGTGYSQYNFEIRNSDNHDKHLVFRCKNCGQGIKRYSIKIDDYDDENENEVRMTKFGEYPPFGIRVPNSVVDIFGDGEDREKFIKGRKSEDSGYGIGAFSYYRRVLDNQKNSLIDEIILACEAIDTDEEIIMRIKKAKKHKKFTMAIDDIKDLIPKSLYVKSHNPLTALHSALSMGIHDLSDSECLGIAKDIRIVLTGLVNRIEALKRDQAQLAKSLQNLLKSNNQDEQ